MRNLILVQAETTWLPVNDNYKEINLESEKMEIYGHWFNMKNLLSLRKSVSGSYPTSKTQFLPFHIYLKYFQMKVLIFIYDLKFLIEKLWSLKYSVPNSSKMGLQKWNYLKIKNLKMVPWFWIWCTISSKKKMEVLRNGATDAFVIGSNILCIYR